jgi:hypothetical protein
MGLPPQIPPVDPSPDSKDEKKMQAEELCASEPRSLEASNEEPIRAELNPGEAAPSESIPSETIPPDVVLTGGDFLSEDSLGADERARLFRRLRWVVVAGVLSFTVVSWMLVRSMGRGEVAPRGSDAAAVVRVELGALASGDLQSAYDQLSERYRKEVSFEAYHQLVITHRRAFLTKRYRVTRLEEHGDKSVLEAELTSSTGQHYLARFTLVNAAGRWWIDDLHWNLQGGDNLTET